MHAVSKSRKEMTDKPSGIKRCNAFYILEKWNWAILYSSPSFKSVLVTTRKMFPLALLTEKQIGFTNRWTGEIIFMIVVHQKTHTLLPYKNRCSAQHCPRGGEQILAPFLNWDFCREKAVHPHQNRYKKGLITFYQRDQMSWPRLLGEFAFCLEAIEQSVWTWRKRYISPTKCTEGESMVT